MNLSEIILNIQELEILCKNASSQKLSGAFKSYTKGRGLVLDSVRKYEIGDDIRDVNWNATARFQETYINAFIEDKAHTIWLLVDISRSGVFGTEIKNKFALSVEIVAAMSYSAIESKNLVGVIFFSDNIHSVIPPARGATHFWRIAKALVTLQPSGKGTNLANAMQYLLKINPKQSVVYVVSDFITTNYKPLAKILAHCHELTAIHVYDEGECNFPKVSWAKLKDSETGSRTWANTAINKFQNNYRKHHQTHLEDLKLFFTQNNSRFLSIHTAENCIERLITFMREV